MNTRRRPTGRAVALILLLAALLVSCDSSPTTAVPPTATGAPPTVTVAPPTVTTAAPTVAPAPSATTPPAPTATLAPPSSPTMLMIAPTSPPAGSPPIVSGTVTIQILDFYFAPSVITVPLGTKIVWTNIGPTEHTVADLTMQIFSSDILQKGASFSWTPDRVGTIPYWCTIHPDMKATLIVTR